MYQRQRPRAGIGGYSILDDRENVMRAALFAVAALTAALNAAPASAQQGGYPLYPWCAYYGGAGRGGGTNCYFSTWQQCQLAISGNGGYCYQNPFYASYRADQVEPVRRYRRY